MLKSPIYEQRFAVYVSTFSDRQREIQFALILHTSLTVESASSEINSIHDKASLADDKLNLMITLLFRRLDSPHESELMKFIDMKGGAEKCMADDKVLMELAAIRRRLQGGPVVVNTPPEGGAMEATPQYRPSRDPQYPSFQPPMGSQYIYIPSRRQYQPNATSHSYYRAHEEHPTQQYLTQQYPTQQYPIQQYPAAYGSRPGQTFYGPDVIAIVRLDELKLEFSEDVDLVLNGNMAIFIKKLDVQKRQLVLELTAVVKTQSDRVIKAVDAGPHDRVVDPVRLRFFFVMPSFAHEITRIFARYGRIW